MKILDGKKLAASYEKEIIEQTRDFKKRGIVPGLAIVLVGQDYSSKLYVDLKEKMATRLGFHFKKIIFSDKVRFEQLQKSITKLNRDKLVHGIIVQLPLPNGLDEAKVLQLVNPVKDIDCFHYENLTGLFLGAETKLPPTGEAAIRLIELTKTKLIGKNVVVVGAGFFGRPIAMMCANRGATVTMVNSKTVSASEIIKKGDIVIACLGKANFIKGSMIKKGAVVVDVGINRLGKKVVGDVDYRSVAKKASAITPVPGGVGPMTVMMLMWNVIQAVKEISNRK